MSATTATQTPTRTSLTIIGRMPNAAEDSATPEPSGESSTRRSTRVRKPPIQYSPPPSLIATTIRKRKRDSRVGAAVDNASDDDEAAASDDDDQDAQQDSDVTGGASDQDDDEDVSGDETTVVKKKANRKPAANSRSKSSRAPPSKPATKKSRTDAGPAPKAKPASRRKSGKGVNGVVELDGEDIFERVLAGEDASKIVQDWVSYYDSNNTEGMVALVNFILRSCGCTTTVSSDDVEDADSAASKLEDIQEIFKKESSVEYPIASRAQKYRRYRTCLTSFFSELIKHISTSGALTSDPALIENMQVWVTTMSSSPLRPFRHTSTAINLAVMTALCGTMTDIEKSINTTTKQLDAEKAKARKNAGRIKSLEQLVAEARENQDFVTEQINDIYETVFVHRYRDVDGKIRAECIHELGIWITKLPSIFFEASYLRYLGWVLSDTAVGTRLEVIRALMRLFKDRANVGGLRSFTERFRERLLEMALQDADSGVRAETIVLLNDVRQVGFLEASDIESLGKLLYDADLKVRNAIADFFASSVQELYDEQIEDCGGEDTVKEALQGAGDLDDEDFEGHQMSWIKLKCLVNSLASYDPVDSEDIQSEGSIAKGIVNLGLQSRFQLAGLALYKSVPELHKWEDLAKYLLYDHTGQTNQPDDDETLAYVKNFCALKAKEETILLHVLHAAIQNSIVAANDPANAPSRSKRKHAEAPDAEEIARGLAHYVPLLLNKFGPPPDTAATVLRIAQLMQMNVYEELRQINTYSLLLDSVVKQFQTHLDQAVLKEASEVLLHASKFEELSEVTSQKISGLLDDVVSFLVALAEGKDLAKDELGEQTLSDLETAVLRLQYLAGITDCREVYDSTAATSQNAKGKNKRKGKEVAKNVSGGDAPIDILISILTRGKATDESENELWLAALQALQYYFMWIVRPFTDGDSAADASADGYQPNLETLRAKETAILTALGTIINVRDLDDVRIAAAGAILGFHCFNAVLSASVKTNLFPAKVSPEDQEDILKVYISAEKRFAKLSNKIVASGSDGEEDEADENNDKEAAVLFEQRLCEFVGKITLAILSEVVDARVFKARLLKNKTQLGPNLREILNFIDPPKPRPSRAKPKPQASNQKAKGNDVIEDSDAEAEVNEQDAHEEEIQRHDDMAREEEEEHQQRQESAPPPADDSDEEMADAD